MNLSIRQLLTWNGTIDRQGYVVWGIVLLAIKYNLDRVTASVFGGGSWFITDYIFQGNVPAISDLSTKTETFYLILVLQSLPFIWFGTVLCVKRLREAALPSWLVIFFFIPFVNLILFILLAAIPARSSVISTNDRFLDRLIPKSRWGSAMLSIGLVLLLSLITTLLLISYMNDYGWSMFVGIPFFLGFGSVLLYGYHRKLSYLQSLGVAVTAVMFFSGIIFMLAFEGVICIAMALPIFFAVAFLGATIGYAIHSHSRTASLNAFVVPVLIIPMIGLVEHQSSRVAPVVSVETEIIVHATRQEVWDQLVAFGRIDEPTELLFRTGIAYPIHAEIEGSGVGATRKCNFTTGPFIEPITVWDEPRLLEFGVLDQPPPMIEWSIYQDMKIPHLDGYFRSNKGQFRLEVMGDGSTRLIGTTWYSHDVWPNIYWQQWSNYILHAIHKRVLMHIKVKAEESHG